MAPGLLARGGGFHPVGAAFLPEAFVAGGTDVVEAGGDVGWSIRPVLEFSLLWAGITPLLPARPTTPSDGYG